MKSANSVYLHISINSLFHLLKLKTYEQIISYLSKRLPVVVFQSCECTINHFPQR